MLGAVGILLYSPNHFRHLRLRAIGRLLAGLLLVVAEARAQEPPAAPEADPPAVGEGPEAAESPEAGETPEAGDSPEAEDSGEAERKLEPPRPIQLQPAHYPPSALARREAATVVLLVTVGVEGDVTDIEVAESAGAEFDRAARDALARWRFEPARRDGVAVPARISVPFHFDPPPVPPEPAPEPTEVDPESAGETPEELIVHGERPLRAKVRSSSDYHIERDVIAAAPRAEGAEVLRSAPGLYIGRSRGLAVGHSYMLRGFDSEHGQDIEFRVGGLPINLPSHIHGQGYADLGFLISETVWDVHVAEGVYDPRQGDFAVAGSIELHLGVGEDRRGVRLQSGYGRFGTSRQQIIWAPEEASNETFGAAQYQRTDGFGENRAAESASAIFQHRFGSGDLSYRAIGWMSSARGQLAGIVRRDDVDAGRICFECAYPYPTAQAQNALATRAMVGLFADYGGLDGGNGQLGVWLGRDDFRLQENYTGFVQRSRTLTSAVGRGDLIEQQNRTTSMGLTGRYRSGTARPTEWAHGTVEVGVDGRTDTIDQSQNLLDASVRRQTWDRRVDAGIRAMDLGLWGDLDWGFRGLLRARAGVRGDVLAYDVDDRLGNFAPGSRPDDAFHPGFRRSAYGVAFGPRTSLEVMPWHFLTWMVAYGEGYRSPQARMLSDGESAPFTKVRSVDLGPRFDFGDPLRLSLSGYHTRLSDDVAFDAEEGRLERIGGTQRLGAVAYAVTRPVPWLVGAASVTYVDATLREPPPATSEEPLPPFEPGQRLPFVPPLVVRTDLGVRGELVADAAGESLIGRIGSGLSALSSRPLPYGEYADPFVLLDASAGLEWGAVELNLECFNLLNAEYAALEYNFASDWDPNGPRTRTPARHLAAGAPFSWMLTLGVTL
jgi:iron complex outermembrane recepter protein